VNVRSQAKFPTSFLNEKQKPPPGGKWTGWVTFDGRVTEMVLVLTQLHRRDRHASDGSDRRQGWWSLDLWSAERGTEAIKRPELTRGGADGTPG